MESRRLTYTLEVALNRFKQGLDDSIRMSGKAGRYAGGEFSKLFGREADKLKVKPGVDDSQVRNSFSRLQNSFNRNLRSLTVRLGGDISGAISALDRFNNKAKSTYREQASFFNSVMEGAVISITDNLLDGIGNAISSLGDVARGVYTVGTEARKTQITFETVLQSATKAKTLMADLQRFADVTPFTTTQVTSASTALIASVKPQDMVKTLEALGNAAVLAKAPIDDLARIYAKVLATGKVQGDEINQFIENGVTPLRDEMAKVLGVTVAQLQELQKEGMVTADVMVQAFANMSAEGGILNGLMGKMSLEVEGLASTIQSNFEASGKAIYNQVEPALQTILEQIMDATAETGKTSTAMDSLGKISNKVTEYLNQNPQVIKELTQGVSDLVDQAMADLVGEAEQLLKYLKENPQWVKQTVDGTKEFFGLMKELAVLTLEIAGLFREIFGWLSKGGKILEEWGQKLKENAEWVRSIADGLGSAMGNVAGYEGTGMNGGKFTVRNPNGSRATHLGESTAHHDYQTSKHYPGNVVKDLTIYDAQGRSNVPVPSPISGTVQKRNDPGGYGHYVTIEGQNGIKVLLGHFKSLARDIKSGDRVQRGQTLGIQGSSGHSTGTHIHLDAPRDIADKYYRSLSTGQWGGGSGAVNGARQALGEGWSDFTGGLRQVGQSILKGGQALLSNLTGSGSGANNRQRFLGAIRHGESISYSTTDPRNISSAGAKGAYQFIPSTRAGIKSRYGVDAYSNNPREQDLAALANIHATGGSKAFSAIDRGDFSEASRLLRHQWTSLPGGAEQSKKWQGKNINNFGLNQGGGLTVKEAQNNLDYAKDTMQKLSRQITDIKDKIRDIDSGTTAASAKAAAGQINKLKAEQDALENRKKAAQTDVDKYSHSLKDAKELEREAKDSAAAAKKTEAENKRQQEAENKRIQEQRDLNEEEAQRLDTTQQVTNALREQAQALNDLNPAEGVDEDLRRIQRDYEQFRSNLESQKQEQQDLRKQTTNPRTLGNIDSNIATINKLYESSFSAETLAIQQHERQKMMDATKAAEEELAAAREKEIQEARDYNDAVFAYLDEKRQRGNRLKEIIATEKQRRYDRQDTVISDQVLLQQQRQGLVSAQASSVQASDPDLANRLGKEAATMQLGIDLTNQLHQIEQLGRTGRFTTSQLEQMRDTAHQIAEINLQGLDQQFQGLGSTILNTVGQAFGQFLHSAITGTESLSDALSNMFASIASSLANMAIQRLLGGILGGGIGGGGGGGLFNFAAGTQGTVEDAMRRERSQSGGRKPILAVLNRDETVLNPEQAERFRQYEKMASYFNAKTKVPNFASGTLPKTMNSVQSSVAVNVPVTVNSEGGIRDSQGMSSKIRAAVTGIIVEHMEQPGGLMKHLSR